MVRAGVDSVRAWPACTVLPLALPVIWLMTAGSIEMIDVLLLCLDVLEGTSARFRRAWGGISTRLRASIRVVYYISGRLCCRNRRQAHCAFNSLRQELCIASSFLSVKRIPCRTARSRRVSEGYRGAKYQANHHSARNHEQREQGG